MAHGVCRRRKRYHVKLGVAEAQEWLSFFLQSLSTIKHEQTLDKKKSALDLKQQDLRHRQSLATVGTHPGFLGWWRRINRRSSEFRSVGSRMLRC